MRNAFVTSTHDELPSECDAREPLLIGLVNNMADAALQTTEQQFRELLATAAGADYDVRLRLFSFPEVIRSDDARAYIAREYEPVEGLWSGGLDGLIVTGTEPRAMAMEDEAYWPALTRLIDRAMESSTPAVWSCLAAHAAVLHLDGIVRHRLEEKLSGVIRCRKVADDPLAAGLPSSWYVPHSRLNTLDSAELANAGYDIVSYCDDGGVDIFALRRQACFLFCQGHPEYDAGALFREYRRDVRRFLSGTIDRYPAMPREYFDDESVGAFGAFRARAERERTRALFGEFPESGLPEKLSRGWADMATRLYRNWLGVVAARSSQALPAVTGR